jgi:ribosomal protein S18 acetylase RimI-like enzyme
VRYLRQFFAHEGKRHLQHPTVITADGHPGAAYWDPPGHWKTNLLDMVGMAPFMVRGMRHRIPRAMKGLGLIEKAHARHPEHYYLAVLGTRPDRQGSGIGSALMQPILDTCDAEGIGAYLESSKEANIPFYRRHGFEVVEVLHLPKGPDLWPMWREPRAPA